MPGDGLLLAWALALTPLAGIAWHAAGAPISVVLGAVVPAVGYLGVLLWLARRADVPLQTHAIAFTVVWAAGVAAPAAAVVNDVLQGLVGAGGQLVSVAAVPAVEETAKAAILIALVAVWRTQVRGLRAGVVAGALVGLGFGFSENVEYFLLARVQDGTTGLARAILVRGFLEGAVHPVFAASTGAGLGLGRAVPRRWRLRPALAGLGAAVAQHALWNGVASPVVSGILCNGVSPSGACRGSPPSGRLLVAVPIVVATALAPGVLTLAALARRARSTAPRA